MVGVPFCKDNSKDSTGNTMLHRDAVAIIAAKLENLRDLVSFLIVSKSHYTDPLVRPILHRSMFERYLTMRRGMKKIRRLEILAAHPEYATMASEADGKTLLHRHHQDDASIQEFMSLIALGAEVNAVDREGNTPLLIAKTVPFIRWLLHAGADPEIANSKLETVLHVVCTRMGAAILIDRAPHLMIAKDCRGYTPDMCNRFARTVSADIQRYPLTYTYP